MFSLVPPATPQPGSLGAGSVAAQQKFLAMQQRIDAAMQQAGASAPAEVGGRPGIGLVATARPGPEPVPRIEVPEPAPDPDAPPIWVERPELPAELDPRLVLLREPDSVRAACYRVLRDRIAERSDPGVIAVTSAEPGDGKTTCAVNLALALGECGRASVLLLEANLRTPSLADLFKFTPPICLIEQLAQHRRDARAPWRVVEAHSEWLHVAAVTPGSVNRPLLDLPAFSAAIAAFRSAGYKYVVIDSPPVLGAADANLIEDTTDGVLMVCRSGKSSARALRLAVEQLAPSKILGTALIDAE
jgi:Mrp family chromosome partitioning ATPase